MLGGFYAAKCSTLSNKEKEIKQEHKITDKIDLNTKSFENLLKLLSDAYPELVKCVSEVNEKFMICCYTLIFESLIALFAPCLGFKTLHLVLFSQI